MHRLLPLLGHTAIGALAGFGLLRVLKKHGVAARLGWNGCAVLEGVDDVEQVIECLAVHMGGRADAAELNLVDGLKKLARDDFLNIVNRSDDEVLEWVAAFWGEEADRIRPSALNMTAGNQKLCAMARKLAGYVNSEGAADCFREALVGPWRYEHDVHSFGWDSAASRDSATFGGNKSPSAASLEGVAGAYWLAFEALPLFPVLDGSTVGYNYSNRIYSFSWPLSKRPLGLAGTRSLILTAGTLSDVEKEALGVQVWQARVERVGSYGSLRPATRV